MFRNRLTPEWRDAGIAGVYTAACVALEHVSYIDSIANLAITPWSPPAGLSVFVLLRFGWRFLPVVCLATLVSDVVVRGVPWFGWLTIVNALAIGGGHAMMAAVLVRYFGGLRSFRSIAELNGLTGVALVGPVLAALVYIGVDVLAGTLPRELVGAAVLRYWIGDALGIFLMVPFLLEFVGRRAEARRPFRAETLLQAAVIIGTSWLVFGLSETDEFKWFYLLFVPIIWVAMRRGIRGAILASLAVQLALVAASGQFTAKGVRLWELQLLLVTLALTALYLGMAVTVRRSAELARDEQASSLERMRRTATAGELAAAIAHELNQPLFALGNYARVCVAMIDQGAPESTLRETLAKVAQEVQRAGEVLRRLREFFRSGASRRERLSLAVLVDDASAAAAHGAAQREVTIDVAHASGLAPVDVDRVQMAMVLRNLLDNAVDALSSSLRPLRRIRVSTFAGEAGSVVCEVSDNGPGIPPEIAGRLFAPFTTTKADGMGFGLQISRSIVEAHGGHLELVESRGAGATFRLTLPPAQSDA
jgi:signal transduction histidine kinase